MMQINFIRVNLKIIRGHNAPLYGSKIFALSVLHSVEKIKVPSVTICY
ncbi:hypothetical protein RchiOBHm_Chr1g0325591 [Rosa chinensis]|uniref:Uncharacterized protein n=1 Tax=Rosa chinensis TaxID=74649 RepID=A0A2P6SA08_ROSCH|nr:hypothetical protein RchiOBHm_Chr1g0325591 [Rosa chinensis]